MWTSCWACQRPPSVAVTLHALTCFPTTTPGCALCAGSRKSHPTKGCVARRITCSSPHDECQRLKNRHKGCQSESSKLMFKRESAPVCLPRVDEDVTPRSRRLPEAGGVRAKNHCHVRPVRGIRYHLKSRLSFQEVHGGCFNELFLLASNWCVTSN